MIRAVIFDLDYTLYDMNQYLEGAYQRVIRKVSAKTGNEFEKSHNLFREVLDAYGYNHDRLFNYWLESMGLPEEPYLGISILEFHRFQPTELQPYPGILELMEVLGETYRIGIVTDGNLKTQQGKVELMNLHKYAHHILYSKELNTSKPDPLVFQRICQMLEIDPHEAIYIGDHPVKDVQGAMQSGMHAARIMKGAYKALENVPDFIPEHILNDIVEIEGILKQINT